MREHTDMDGLEIGTPDDFCKGSKNPIEHANRGKRLRSSKAYWYTIKGRESRLKLKATPDGPQSEDWKIEFIDEYGNFIESYKELSYRKTPFYLLEKRLKSLREKIKKHTKLTDDELDSHIQRFRREIEEFARHFQEARNEKRNVPATKQDKQGYLNTFEVARRNVKEGTFVTSYVNHPQGIMEVVVFYPNDMSREATEERRRKLTNTPVFLKTIYSVDGNTIFEIENAGSTFRGTISDIVSHLQREAKCVSKGILQDGVSAIIHSQIQGKPRIVTHSACGIYQDEGRITPCVAESIPLTSSQQKQFVTISFYWNKELQNDMVREILECYRGLIDFYHSYEILPSMGLGAIAPFAYILKSTKRIDYVPFVLNVGPHGLGKTSVTEAFTSRLWGTALETGKSIDSQFRLEEALDSTTFPVKVGEAEKVRFNDYIPILKNASEQSFLSSRGRGDLSKQMYFSRSVFFFDANSMVLSDPNLLPRFIVSIFDVTKRPEREKNKERFEKIFKKIEPIGRIFYEKSMEFLSRNGTSPLDNLIKMIDEASKKIALQDIKLEDARRATVWGIVYVGLTLWSEVFRIYGIEWGITLDNFSRDVIAPIERQCTDEYSASSPMQFMAWFELYRETELTRVTQHGKMLVGKGELWDETEDGIVITFPILERYKEHAQRTQNIPFQSLRHLAREVANVYRMQEQDVYKARRFGKKIKKSVLLPAREVDDVGEY